MRLVLVLGLLPAIAAGVGVSMMAKGNAQTPTQPQSLDLHAGEQLYQGYCASCHGANLEGQPNWRLAGADGIMPAPPHDENGHTWHHSDRVLFDYTKLGGTEALARQGVSFVSGMPGFAEQLTDAEIWNILGFIKSTWPDRQREIQAARSSAVQ
ncbi:cytochrome c (plasmid) [Pseudohalocynthiibacter aestuariivivens]|jgi:mono/diheme cytochrome c family protein|nr:cytochrome c [Pseudohalocynthiibacter aestuariivivens]